MISLDTNIIARLWVEDNPGESRLALTLMEVKGNKEQLFISLPVLIELVWVLSRKGFKRSAIYQALQQLVQTDHIVVGQHDLVTDALALYGVGKADFADYIIMCESAKSGARALASFDAVLMKEQASYCKHPAALLQ